MPEDQCLCMKGPDLDYLNGQLIALEQCQVREAEFSRTLEALKSNAVDQDDSAWWRRGEVVVGGVVVSFALGGLIGYLVAK